MERVQVTLTELKRASDDVQQMTATRLAQKGSGIFVSSHEMLGAITEEHVELIAAVTSRSHMRESAIRHELIGIAVSCIIALASYETGAVEW